ncbi:MAG: hypothetical protein COT92_03685 [Candidatus Doudnabacteria bacterium CG10_big_fil_rev_8_21_14_0_10_42_18]|uniref:Uncharacterized protein n=1 Tax=Candidatus Doudnabacteria bacterium CG10_big_fil_rev_8_21_14_0_10_42_18 TaxID=1974552 RepID=A0A2H0VA41_9BACT|nr:MAG: hypothetical protein COT92_03685 [Candidatus Doudnabacteria bacterium CG10_big_fil_rev_8_21_14_0_10_42_18]
MPKMSVHLPKPFGSGIKTRIRGFGDPGGGASPSPRPRNLAELNSWGSGAYIALRPPPYLCFFIIFLLGKPGANALPASSFCLLAV